MSQRNDRTLTGADIRKRLAEKGVATERAAAPADVTVRPAAALPAPTPAASGEKKG